MLVTYLSSVIYSTYIQPTLQSGIVLPTLSQLAAGFVRENINIVHIILYIGSVVLSTTVRCSIMVVQTRLSLQRNHGNVGAVALSEKATPSLGEIDELEFASKGEPVVACVTSLS